MQNYFLTSTYYTNSRFILIFTGSSDEQIDQCGINDLKMQAKSQAQRCNTTVHVCWHRSTSISMKDELLAVEVG